MRLITINITTEDKLKFFRFFFLLAVLSAPLYHGAVPLWSFSACLFVLTASFLGFRVLHRPSAALLERRPWGTALTAWMGAYLLFFSLAAANSEIPFKTVVEYFKLLGVVCVFIATRVFCENRVEVRRLCLALTTLGGVLSLVGLLQFLGGLPRGWWHRPEFLSSVYVNHNHFAGFLEIILPLSLGLALGEKSPPKKSFIIFSCALMSVAFVFTLSRGGALAVTGALLFMIWLLARRGVVRDIRWVLVPLGIWVILGLATFGVGPVFERIWSLERIDEELNRVLIWRGALSVIKNHFWLGTGPGTFETVFLQFRPAGFTARPQFAHNDYLELLAEGGIFTFLAAMGFFVTLFGRGLGITAIDESRTRTGVGTGCLAGFFSLGLHSLVDFNFHIPANALLAGVTAGILVSLDPRLEGPPSRPLRTAPVFFLTNGLFSVVLLGSVFSGLSDFFLWRANNAYGKKDLEAARRQVDLSLKVNRFNDKAYFLKGLTALDRREDAAPDLEKAVRLNPFEPYYDYNLGRNALRVGNGVRAAKALPYFEEAIRKDAGDPRLYFLAANELLKANREKDPVIERRAKEMLKTSVGLDWKYGRRVKNA